MTEPVPLLQIIHVSDLHVQKGLGDRHALSFDDRHGSLWFRERLAEWNVGGWHEGTQGHSETALHAFEQFLADAKLKDKTWFPTDRPGPETWLLDTGDATTAGDATSLLAAQDMFNRWTSILQPCRVRTIFGNHDAWPGTQPCLIVKGYESRIAEQQGRLYQREAWRPNTWLEPLSTRPAQGMPRIECYALNTVSFSWLDNVMALGRIAPDELERLQEAILHRGDHPAYRILLTHHPLVFPYERRDRKGLAVFDQMVLKDANKVVHELLNPATTTPSATKSPYIHLFLSGHTHLAAPGRKLAETVKEVHQGTMGRTQLQLVNGSLMLTRSKDAILAQESNRTHEKANSDFSDPSVFAARQQFQILRFFHDPDRPDGLWLERVVMARSAASRDSYAPIPEMISTTYVSYGDDQL